MAFEMVMESSKHTGGKKKLSLAGFTSIIMMFLKNFQTMIKRLSLPICRKGKEEEQVNTRCLV